MVALTPVSNHQTSHYIQTIPVNFPQCSSGCYIFEGVKQIGGRTSKTDLTRSTLHIIEAHKLGCKEAVIYQAGAYETIAEGLLAQLYTMVKPVGQPSRRLKKEKKEGRAQSGKGPVSKHLDPSYWVRAQCID